MSKKVRRPSRRQADGGSLEQLGGAEVETRDKTARILKLRDRAAIAEKATIALQIAHSEGDAEVAAKYRAANDPPVFWAYVAGSRPVYT